MNPFQEHRKLCPNKSDHQVRLAQYWLQLRMVSDWNLPKPYLEQPGIEPGVSWGRSRYSATELAPFSSLTCLFSPRTALEQMGPLSASSLLVSRLFLPRNPGEAEEVRAVSCIERTGGFPPLCCLPSGQVHSKDLPLLEMYVGLLHVVCFSWSKGKNRHDCSAPQTPPLST